MDVVVVGSCFTDFVTYASRLPKCGETLFGHAFKTGFGGKGANQCVVASRLGAHTAMVAKVGNDIFGTNYIQNFKDNKVDIGNNAIVIVGGANLQMTEEDVSAAESVIKTSKVLVCQLEIPSATTLAALQLGKKYGVVTILNPAPAQEGLPQEFYAGCDIFCPNETEAELLLGESITTLDDAKAAVGKLISKGCHQVVMTLGDKGCVYGSKEKPTAIHVATSKVQCVDTTGAGDAFVGALAYYLSNKTYSGLSMEEKLKRSCKIASMSVQKEGTQTSYPQKDQIPPELLQ